MKLITTIRQHKWRFIIAGVSLIALVAIIVITVLSFSKRPSVLDNYVASDNDNPFIVDTGYKKPEIKLDGIMDDSQWTDLAELTFGDTTSAEIKAFYGESGIYIGACVSDADLCGSSTNVYDNSSFEVYLDSTGTGDTAPVKDDFQIFIDVKEQSLARRGDNGVWVETNLIKNYAVETDGTLGDLVSDTGYTVELFIPYSQLGGKPQINYGVAFGLVECSSGTRNAWVGLPGVNVQSPATYYKFYQDTNTIEPTRKVNTAEISIDGKDDETQWSGKSSYVFGDGGRGAVKSFYGEKGLYLYFDMQDNKVFSQESTPYLNDSVEVYLDTLKNGGTKPQSDDVQVRADVGGNIEVLKGDGTEWMDTLNNVFCGTKVNGTLNGEASGYTLELFMPWSDLGMTSAPVGMNIDFGSVDYDGEKNADGSRVTAWSGTGRDVQAPETYLPIDSKGVQGAVAPASTPEIVLDGVLNDAKWSGTPAFAYNSGKVSVNWSWTDQGCYMGFTVKDTSVQTDGVKPYENSSIELYLDYNKNGGTPDDDDRTILVDAAGNMLFRKGIDGAYKDFGTRSILSGVKKTDTGYVVELYIPWSEFGSESKPNKMGIAFGQVTRNSTAKETIWTNDGLCFDPQNPDKYSIFTADHIGK